MSSIEYHLPQRLGGGDVGSVVDGAVQDTILAFGENSFPRILKAKVNRRAKSVAVLFRTKPFVRYLRDNGRVGRQCGDEKGVVGGAFLLDKIDGCRWEGRAVPAGVIVDSVGKISGDG